MKKSGTEAALQMWHWWKGGRTGVKGFCLRTCREAWGLPSQDASAIDEWNSIRPTRKSNDWRKAPIGATHFWAGGQFGHVTIQSGSAGYVFSTDAPESDHVGKVRIDYFAKRWHYHYLGWTTEFQGKKLPLKDMPKQTVYGRLKGYKNG